jgi:hypothetical protein
MEQVAIGFCAAFNGEGGATWGDGGVEG